MTLTEFIVERLFIFILVTSPFLAIIVYAWIRIKIENLKIRWNRSFGKKKAVILK